MAQIATFMLAVMIYLSDLLYLKDHSVNRDTCIVVYLTALVAQNINRNIRIQELEIFD